MKIEELPPELLIQIFKYLPTYKRVSLVTRRFYEVACEVNDKNVSLTLDHRLLAAENLPQLLSIKTSNRKISKVAICCYQLTEDDLRTLLSIISKYSATIKYLEVVGGSIRTSFFLKILSLVPNAEHLSFYELRVSHADAGKMKSNEDLNLQHLRILDLIYCEEQFQVVFNRLPAGVLTKLLLNEGYLLSLKTFFSRQTNIKKLSLIGCRSDALFTAHILDNLELKSLNLKYMDIETAALSRQTKLISLTVNATYQVDEHLIEVVAKTLTELEELNCDTRTTVIDFVNIKRLKNLKHLRLDFWYRRPDIVDGLIELDNSRIATLEMLNFHDLTNHQIQALAESAPKLKNLKIFDYLKCEEYTAVLKHFNFVECLSFGSFFLEGNYVNYLNQNEFSNTKLTELRISIFQYEVSLLSKMIDDFPNLKKLKIVSGNDLASSHFRLIVNGFTKLESLDLCHGKPLTIDDFKYLRDHRKRLQTLWLRRIVSDDYVNRHLEVLEAMFEVVKYSHFPVPSLLLKI